MKKTLLLAVTLVLMLIGTVCVQAADVDINEIIGEYYDAELEKENEGDLRITVATDISYSPAEDLYYYYVSDFSGYFTSNIMTGMVTQDKVSITSPAGVLPSLYRNGKLYEGDLTDVTDIGSYVLRVIDNSGTSRQIMEFVIVGADSGFMSVYTMPQGFTVRSVTLDGETPLYYASSVPLSAEGDYVITYACDATGKQYVLKLAVDSTAPALTFVGLDDGVAWGPVDISPVGANEKLEIYLNNEKIATEYTLTKSGKYHLVVTDSAGNQQTYDFTIMIYLNWSGIALCVIILLLLGGVIGYIIFSRKKLRVR